MEQERKDILFKDLCTRLPYRVKVKITSEESKNRIVYLTENNICHLTNGWWSECKPYLFPLSSMTEEQREEYESLCIKETSECANLSGFYFTRDYYYDTVKSIDYLYKNHIDIRGLIPMGSAIDATGLNIY